MSAQEAVSASRIHDQIQPVKTCLERAKEGATKGHTEEQAKALAAKGHTIEWLPRESSIHIGKSGQPADSSQRQRVQCVSSRYRTTRRASLHGKQLENQESTWRAERHIDQLHRSFVTRIEI
jgi:hypothetical protein